MAVKIVTLNYGPGAEGGFGPTPKQVTVKSGDKIRFLRGPNNPPNTGIRITLKTEGGITEQLLEKSFSERQVLHRSNSSENEAPELEVRAALTGNVSYRCELLDSNGNVLSVSEGGGEIVPDTGS